MNEKLTLQDLVDLLAQKKGITKKDAELFLKEFFTLLSDTVCDKESVKIKDLGTFKLTPVSRRESVDVNTGDKIEIPAHYRLSFQPDKELKDLVNKPFASFESILLEDGEDRGDVSFDIQESEIDLPDGDSEEEEIELEIDLDEKQEVEVENVPSVNPIVESVEPIKKDILVKEDPIVVVEKTLVTVEETPSQEQKSEVFETRHGEIPIIPPVEYSYSTTVNPSEGVDGILSSIKEKQIEVPSGLANESNVVFKESSSNDVAIPTPPPAIKTEQQPESGLSRNLLSEEGNENEIIDTVDTDVEGDQGDDPVDQTTYEETPDFYSYQPTFWTKFWRRLPLILFILVVLGGLAYAFLNLFDVKYDYERFFGKKSVIEQTEDSLSVAEPTEIKDNTLALDSVADETSKRLDSLKQQIKNDKLDLVSPKESVPNVNKAEAKVMSESSTSQPIVRETIKTGATLRTLATRYYGQSAFWVYIYEENKNIIDDPDNIPLGLSVSIPKAEKYGIDAKDVNSMSKAKEKELEIVRKARQKRFQNALSD